MKKHGIIAAAVVLAGMTPSARAEGRTEFPKQDKARVAEIAALLRPEAGFAETRVGNRADWDRVAGTDPKAAADLIRKGEVELTKPLIMLDESKYLELYTNVCATSSDVYTWWTKERFLVGSMKCLAYAECLEGKGRFLGRITEILDQFAAVRTWVTPYHDKDARSFKGEIKKIELCGGIVAMEIAEVVDVLREALPSEMVERAKKAVRSNAIDVYLAIARNSDAARKNDSNWVWCNNNWNAACNHYMVASALYFLDDPQERAECIELAERSIASYLAGFTRDGLSLEGPGYWSYGFGNYLQLAIQVRRATGGRNPFVTEFAERVMESGFGVRYNDMNVPAFGDAGSKTPDPPPAGTWYLGSLVWPRFACLVSGHCDMLNGGLFQTMVTKFPCPGIASGRSYAASYRYPIRSWYEDDAQQLVCRPFCGKNRAIYAAFKGGNNGSNHNHNDIGTYTVAIDGSEVVCDPGIKAYDIDSFGPKRYDSAIRNSYGHPVPLVDGVKQSAGRQFAARLMGHSFTDAKDEVKLDLSGAYECMNVEKLVRRFSYCRDVGKLVVTDGVKFRKPGLFESPIITFGTLIPHGDGLYEVVSKDGKDKVMCRVQATGGRLAMRYEELEDTGVHQGSTRGRPKRFAFAFVEPVTEGSITLTYWIEENCDGV